MKKILVFVGALVTTIALYAETSPVVQVVSYKEPLGLYFSLQGWGSGSVIDQQGHIITNNHVVDDGAGGVSDDFAICITDNPSLPPKCHYTASVIVRDIDADIALLKLDSTDIFGKSVNFSGFATLPVNMNYVPKAGDTVVAHGYPWVGANTITETQGIISGTAQYNGHTYIKTDTLIAGGNSGGPLVKDGALVGVNTFLVGGGYDPSLGYSLSIREAEEFIQQAFTQQDALQSNSAGFPQFLQTIETFSSRNMIQDPLITIRLPEKYTIQSYIPSTSLVAALADTNTTSVSSFGFYHIQTPAITDVASLKKYLAYDMGAQDISLSPVTLGGKSFYEISFDQDAASKTKNIYIYVSVVDETHLLFLYLETPVPTKNTLDSIGKSVKSFLQNISFPGTFVFPGNSDLNLPSGIRMIQKGNAAISYDITEYKGLLGYFIRNRQDFVMMKNYLGSFWQRAQVSFFQNSFETEDDTPEMWLKNITQDMYETPLVKKQVTYKGYPGFLVCSSDVIMDMASKNQDIIRCEVVIFVGDHNEYILSVQMILPRAQLKRIDTLMVQYMNKILEMPEQGKTVFSSGSQGFDMPYDDVGNQTVAYRQALSTLISYGILQSRPHFEGDAPLTWHEYMSLYLWSVYHKRMTDTTPEGKTFEQIFSVIPVGMNDYAEDDMWYLERLDSLIRLLVAGGSLPRYDFENISDFSDAAYGDDGIYKTAWDTIYSFEASYFSHTSQIQTTPYISQSVITYNPFTGLSIQSKNDVRRTAFFRDSEKEKGEAQEFLQCDKAATTYFSLACREMRKKAILESLSYPVLTKGKAIQNILEKVDGSLWAVSEKK